MTKFLLPKRRYLLQFLKKGLTMWTTQTTNNVQTRSAKAQFVAATTVWSNLQTKGEAVPSLEVLKTDLKAGSKTALAKARMNALKLIQRDSL